MEKSVDVLASIGEEPGGRAIALPYSFKMSTVYGIRPPGSRRTGGRAPLADPEFEKLVTDPDNEIRQGLRVPGNSLPGDAWIRDFRAKRSPANFGDLTG